MEPGSAGGTCERSSAVPRGGHGLGPGRPARRRAGRGRSRHRQDHARASAPLPGPRRGSCGPPATRRRPASTTASSTSSCATPRSMLGRGRGCSTRSAATRCGRAPPSCACSTASTSTAIARWRSSSTTRSGPIGASLQALAFAARRLRRDPVLLCLVVRTEGLDDLPANVLRLVDDAGRRLVVGPLDRAAVRLLAEQPERRGRRGAGGRSPARAHEGQPPPPGDPPRGDATECPRVRRRAPVAAAVRQPGALEGGIDDAGRSGRRRRGGGGGRPDPACRRGDRRRRGRARRGGRRGGGARARSRWTAVTAPARRPGRCRWPTRSSAPPC